MAFYKLENGKINTVKLEYNLTAHCNYSCSQCYQFSPYNSAEYARLNSFVQDLTALQRVYHARRFRFVGGEPLLHKDILAFIYAVRNSGIADKIEVVTNGSLLHKVGDEVFREIDMLSVSWYPDPRCDKAKIALAKQKCKQYQTQLTVKRIERFRTTEVDHAIDDDILVRKIYESCQAAHTWHCQTFYDGYFYLCSRPLFATSYLKHNLQQVPDFKKLDGVPLHEDFLLERLCSVLSSDRPLTSCQYCFGTVGKLIPWRLLSAHERRHSPLHSWQVRAQINFRKMWSLLGWQMLERRIMKIFPSLHLWRALTLAKNALIRD